MNIQSILAVTDLSELGNRAVHRAALIAARHRALLKIMCAPHDVGAAQPIDAHDAVRSLAFQVHIQFDILVKNVSNISGDPQAIAEEARWVDMLVVGERRERSLTSFLCGQAIERLQRALHCPILVVRLEPFHRYRRILVAVDVAPKTRTMVDFSRSIDRGAQIELSHAAIGRGNAARQAVVQQQHANAELLVVGKRRRSAFLDFLLGSEARHVLRWSKGDVLLVPSDLRNAGAAFAPPLTARRDPMTARVIDGRTA